MKQKLSVMLVEKKCIECGNKFEVRPQYEKLSLRCKPCQAYRDHECRMQMQRNRRARKKALLINKLDSCQNLSNNRTLTYKSATYRDVVPFNPVLSTKKSKKLINK
jgi:hypothetical protein